jgi:hypothetical protein
MAWTTPNPEEQVLFLRSIQRLLAEGLFVATYKFALVHALADLAVLKRGRFRRSAGPGHQGHRCEVHRTLLAPVSAVPDRQRNVGRDPPAEHREAGGDYLENRGLPAEVRRIPISTQASSPGSLV